MLTLGGVNRKDENKHTQTNLLFRSILGVPWFEMGGKVSIDCEKTGYSANIEFLTKVC